MGEEIAKTAKPNNKNMDTYDFIAIFFGIISIVLLWIVHDIFVAPIFGVLSLLFGIFALIDKTKYRYLAFGLGLIVLINVIVVYLLIIFIWNGYV